MNPGLTYLLRKAPAARWRSLRRRVRGPKRTAWVIGGVLLTLVIVLPQIVMTASSNPNVRQGASPDSVRTTMPLVLLFMTLMTLSSSRGLYFKPAEVNLLFPAPVGRRELLVYLVCSRLGVMLISSLWIALFLGRHATHWLAGLFGLYLSLVFLYLVGQLSGLIYSAVSVRLGARIRRWSRLALLGLFLVGVLYAQRRLPGEQSWAERLRFVVNSPVVTWLAAPLSVFAEVFLADDWHSFLGWSGAALALLAALFAGILRLDVSYAEGAAESSRRLHEQIKRMRIGQPARTSVEGRRIRFGLPQLPRMSGVGPIAWWHWLQVIRNLRPLLVSITVMMVVAFMPTFVARRTASAGGGSAGAAAGIGAVMVMLLMTRQMFRFDFGDANRIAFLKSLPLSPTVIAAGHILPSAVMHTLLQLIIGSVLIAVLEPASLRWSWIAPALLPFNWLLSAIDQSLFLLLPYQTAGQAGADVQFAPRGVVTVMVRMLVCGVVVGLALLVGFLAWKLSGQSGLAASLAATLVLAAVGAPLTLVAGALFSNFDVAKDLPQ